MSAISSQMVQKIKDKAMVECYHLGNVSETFMGIICTSFVTFL